MLTGGINLERLEGAVGVDVVCFDTRLRRRYRDIGFAGFFVLNKLERICLSLTTLLVVRYAIGLLQAHLFKLEREVSVGGLGVL